MNASIKFVSQNAIVNSGEMFRLTLAPQFAEGEFETISAFEGAGLEVEEKFTSLTEKFGFTVESLQALYNKVVASQLAGKTLGINQSLVLRLGADNIVIQKWDDGRVTLSLVDHNQYQAIDSFVAEAIARHLGMQVNWGNSNRLELEAA